MTNTRVGYSGGVTRNPTYEDVCSHATGHAEVVEVEYDPTQINFAALLGVFWAIHDPTTRDRQGPDIGSQYRSAIYFTTPGQEAVAWKSAHKEGRRLAAQRGLEVGGWQPPLLATEIALAAPFYEAEEYHQKYHAKHGFGSCRLF